MLLWTRRGVILTDYSAYLRHVFQETENRVVHDETAIYDAEEG